MSGPRSRAATWEGALSESTGLAGAALFKTARSRSEFTSFVMLLTRINRRPLRRDESGSTNACSAVKEEMLDDVAGRHPPRGYVVVDDKVRTLAAIKPHSRRA